MEYKIEEADRQKFNKFRLISRLTSQDISDLKNLYNKYINKYLKKAVCYTCPDSVRNVLGELNRFEEKSTYIEPEKPKKKTRKKKNAGGNTTKRKSKPTKKSNK